MIRLMFDGPSDAALGLVLAHGAGAGMDGDFMQMFARGLAERGVRVARFEFAYMERRRHGRRSPPERMPKLRERYRAVFAQLGPKPRWFIGGKSMGGRVASMLADELGVPGVVCLGYPFHPPGAPERTRTEHLLALRTPCLIVQGTRDSFGTPEEVRRYQLPDSIRVCWIEDGDHSLVPRRSSGSTVAQARTVALDATREFMHAVSVRRTRAPQRKQSK